MGPRSAARDKDMSITATRQQRARPCATALGCFDVEVERLLDLSLAYGLTAERETSGNPETPSPEYLRARAHDYWCAAARVAAQQQWREQRPTTRLIRFAAIAA